MCSSISSFSIAKPLCDIRYVNPLGLTPYTIAFMGFVFLLLAQLVATGTGINGSWYLEGYHAEGFISSVDEPSRLSGTAQISSTQIAFSTNLENWTDPVTFTGSGSNYRYEMRNPSLGDIITRLWEIKVIDEGTLLLSYGEVDYDTVQEVGLRRISGYEWISAVLTKSPVPVSVAPPTTPQPWAGKYSTHVLGMTEENALDGLASGSDTSTDRIIKSGGDFKLISGQDFESINLSQTAQVFALSSTESNTNRTLLWSDDVMDVYRIRDQINSKFLYLGGGRIVAMEATSTLGQAVLPANSYDLFWDIHHYTYLFEAISFANATLVGGTVKVLRDGAEVPVLAGDPLFEKDVIITSDGSFVKVTCLDGTVLTCGPNSMLEIKEFSFDKGRDRMIFNLIKGAMQDFATGQIEKDGVKIKTRNVAIGVRGTEFSIGLSESGGLFTSTVDVTSGIVDFADLQTGLTYEVLAGGNRSVTTPVELVDVTFNTPLGGGSIKINGASILEFPHTITTSPGAILELEAVPNAGRKFHQWWGRNELFTEQAAYVVVDDEFVNCDFTLPQGESEVLFEQALDEAGLDEDADTSPEAEPFHDGVSNLLKWAFNMDLSGPDHRTLELLGIENAGLPSYSLERLGGSTSFKMSYLRRKDGSVVYRPMRSADLLVWEPFAVAEATTPLSDGLERVALSIPVTEDITATGFLRLDVLLAP